MSKRDNPDDERARITGEGLQGQDEDFRVIRRILEGETEEYRQLVERYQGQIYSLILHMLHDSEQARDLTQETFVKAWEALPSFRQGHRFFSWIYRIALNLAINRARKRYRTVSLSGAMQVQGEDHQENRDDAAHIEMAIAQLKADHRVVIILKYYQGMSYEEIAEAIGISTKRVRSRLFEARVRLKDILERSGYYEH